MRRELVIDPTAWKNQRVVDDEVVAAAFDDRERDEALLAHSGSALEHVFTVLGLVLPAEPLRIALSAVQADDPALRATALEYLESILPVDVRAQLWPLLEGETASAARSPRSHGELVAAMNLAYPTIRVGLIEKRAQRG